MASGQNLRSELNDELETLLEEWGFSHIYFELKAEEIDINRLRFLTEPDLNHIFRNLKIGAKAEFRYRLLKWKEENGYNDLQSCDTISNSTGASLRSCHTSETCSSKDTTDLQLFLAEHPTGDFVDHIMTQNHKLNDAARKILIEAIVTWHMKRKIKVSTALFEKISVCIEAKYKDDKNIYFNKSEGRCAGRLYDKYYNTLKRFKKSGEYLPQTPASAPKSPESPSTYNEEEISMAYDWLKVFTEPWNDVQENWKKCFSKRRSDVLSEENALNLWRLFEHSMGHNLVQLDFEALYPNSPSVVSKWNTFQRNILPIFQAKVKDPSNLKYIDEINSQVEGSEPLTALLLHTLLRPNIKRKANNSQSSSRSTVIDSQNSFLQHAITANDVQNKLDKLKSDLHKRGQSLQPVIVAVGQYLTQAKFYVYYDVIKYELPSFLHSFDICFKIFVVLNLKYPDDSTVFWTFVQKYFYEITFPGDKYSPNILALIRDLV